MIGCSVSGLGVVYKGTIPVFVKVWEFLQTLRSGIYQLNFVYLI